MKDVPAFILASGSPRRQQLLREAGYRFDVVPPPLHEPQTLGPNLTPTGLAEALAYFKASAVHHAHPDRIVVGADTIVACGGRVFGKAADAAQARWMLTRLSGVRQEVITGLAVLLPIRATVPAGAGTSMAEAGADPEWDDLAGSSPSRPPRRLAAATTGVTMRRLTAAEIDAYVASGEWRDKAGAYAIQETADAFIETIEGSVTNVVGLPMELLEQMLRQAQEDIDH